MNEYFVIIDSNYLCYVNKFGISKGMEYLGSPTEIIYGFFRQILFLAKQFETSHFAFCWDSKISKRKEILPEYKGQRRIDLTEDEKESNKIAYRQFSIIQEEALPMFGFKNIFSQEGYESDDLIAHLVQTRTGKNIVVTSDNDLYQLLDHCSLYNIVKKSSTNLEMFKKEYGVDPVQWIKVKSLAGCVSDNIPGIEGVGEKTAIKFITNTLKPGKIMDRILSSAELQQRNECLVKLPFDGLEPLPIRKPASYFYDDFETVCEKYGFQSFLSGNYLKDWERIFSLK